MNEAERKPRVTLEDLLQLKRSERPSDDFWPRFEEELRAKQLAALVQPARPWWRGLASRRLLVRIYAPLGAAAVVALSFGSMYKPSAPQVAVVRTSVEAAPVSPARAEIQLAEVVVAPAEQPPVVAMHESRHEAVAEPVSTGTSSSTPEQLLLVGTATVKAAGQVLAQMVGLAEPSANKDELSQSELVEPLAQLATPRDSRRSRLLAYSVAYDPHSPDSKDSARSRERITRRISDESIYDSISRLGVSGDRVSIKF